MRTSGCWSRRHPVTGCFCAAAGIPADGLRDAEVILGNVPRSVLREAIRLRWLQLNSAGADLYLQPGVLPEGVQLTNATEPMARRFRSICWP